MCIAVVVLNYSERFPLIIAHNREEDMARPTSSVVVRDDILSARDLRAGGVAAVGVNVRTGTFAVLTNCRINGSFHPDGESRGSLIKEVLINGISPTLTANMPKRQFQGDFHLLTGNAFVGNTAAVTYLTNINAADPDTLSLESKSAMRIIVRMNEHPSSLPDWQPKLDYVRTLIDSELRKHPHMETCDEVLRVFQQCMSRTSPVCESVTEDTSYTWSPAPQMEPTVLRHILVPPIELGDGSSFGTVSQTVIVVDRAKKEVHFNYRTVDQIATDGPIFSPWDRHLVSYIDLN